MPNTFLDKWTLIIVRGTGVIALIWQILQFFTGRWTYEWYYEVGMLILFFILARYPKQILFLFKRKTK